MSMLSIETHIFNKLPKECSLKLSELGKKYSAFYIFCLNLYCGKNKKILLQFT